MSTKNQFNRCKISASSGDWSLIELTDNDSDVVITEPEADFLMAAEIFDSCPFKDAIFEDAPDAIAIGMGSSYLYGVHDEHSDYDPNVFVDGSVTVNTYQEHARFLIYKGCKFHWYIHGSKDDYSHKGLCLSGRIRLMNLKPEHFIYVKQGNEWLVENLLKKKDCVSTLGCKAMLKRYKSVIEDLAKSIPEKRLIEYGKFCQSYYLAALAETGRKVEYDDACGMCFKRIRYKEFNEADVQKLIDACKEYEKNPLRESFEEIAEKVDSEFRSIWNKE